MLPQSIASILFIFLFSLAPVLATAAAPIAVFPFQELGEGRNDANLPFSKVIAERLENSGNQVIGPDTVIRFMANNRIRTLGHMDSFDINRVRSEIGAAFVLLGTVSQRKERPEPSLGLTLNLVRTSDARTVWTYAEGVSRGEERKILGIGEPQAVADLQPYLLERVIEQWPWEIVNAAQAARAVNIDSVLLRPGAVSPGGEIACRVRLRDSWPAGQQPRIFFTMDDQLYPATASGDGYSYEGNWVAGDKNGRFPVSLYLEWPEYERTEKLLLGHILVDGTPPLFELDLAGTQLINDVPTFSSQVRIIPRMIVRKPMSRWRLVFYRAGDDKVGEMSGEGNMPSGFVWKGRSNSGDGLYDIVLEAWDQAGNFASARTTVALARGQQELDLALNQNGKDISVDLKHDGKVPIKRWRLDMWTREGRLLTRTAGDSLPAKIDFEIPEGAEGQPIEGYLFYQDQMGQEVSRKLGNLLAEPGKPKQSKPVKEPEGISESWVEEF